jgi:hypothetical protein
MDLDSSQRQVFFYSTALRPALWRTQPPVQQVPGLKQWERDAHYLPSYSVWRSRLVELYTHSLMCLHDVMLNLLSTRKFVPFWYNFMFIAIYFEYGRLFVPINAS